MKCLTHSLYKSNSATLVAASCMLVRPTASASCMVRSAYKRINSGDHFGTGTRSCAASRKTPTGKVETIVLEEIAEALLEAGIELQSVHAEAAPGQVRLFHTIPLSLSDLLQYEVVTGPLPPMESADALVFTRETIYNIASKHGLRATLAPRIHPNSGMSHTFDSLCR